jgi:hypothetical protein
MVVTPETSGICAAADGREHVKKLLAARKAGVVEKEAAKQITR